MLRIGMAGKSDASPLLLAFGARLEAVRRTHGRAIGKPRLSMTHFAVELGVNDPAYRRYERGETQPTLFVLERLRRLTGISLDWLVCGIGEGVPAVIPATVTVGDRLRWARETQEPWLNSCAAVMRIAPAEWQAYESNHKPLPVATALEFAHRFSVSLDYLYVGRLDGVDAAVKQKLIEAHPELVLPPGPNRPDPGSAKAPIEPIPADTGRATDDGSTSRSGKQRHALSRTTAKQS
jgi:transcriptional regulator with XRE-family HTH domain